MLLMSEFGTVDVCLASINSSAETICRTLRSILTQDYEDLRINLYLSPEPRLVDSGISGPPSDLRVLQEEAGERLRIHYTKNTGSYRTLLPYLQEYWGRSRLVVTADDETIYPKDWLLSLLSIYQSVGCSVAFRGHRIVIEGERFAPYEKWMLSPIEENPSKLIVPTGRDGILYDTAFFPFSVLKLEAAMLLAPEAENLWLRWNLAMNGIAVYVIDTDDRKSLGSCEYQECLLLNSDQLGGYDAAIDALDTYFKDAYSFDLKSLADTPLNGGSHPAQPVPSQKPPGGASEYKMISDSCFREVAVNSKLPGQVKLSNHWMLALQGREPETHGEVWPEPLSGIRISWEGTPKLVQLWQDLEVSAADAATAVDVEVTLTLQTVADNPKLIDYVAIEKHTGADWVQEKLRLKVSSQGEDGVITIVGRATAFQFEQEKHRLRIQFNKTPKSLILRSVFGTLREHAQSLPAFSLRPKENG